MGKNLFARSAALAALASAVGITVGATDAAAQATTAWAGAPRTQEEDRQFKINGRVHYDLFSVTQDFANPATADVEYSGSFARRAFIGVEGRFTTNWRYNIKFDLAPSDAGTNEVRFDDAFLEYAADDYSIFLGQGNPVSHLEDRTSSNYTPFNERSMIDQAYGFGKIMHIAATTNGGNWSAGVAVYTDTLNNAQTLATDEQTAEYLRLTWAPIFQRTPEGASFVHLGFNARHRDGGSGLLSYSARPNQNSLTSLGTTVSSAGNFGKDDLLGFELAGQWNAIGFTTEYMTVSSDRAGSAVLPDAESSGGYVDLSWSPTGEGRNYAAVDGSWGRVTPRRTLGSDGGIGHVMLSARYEWLDMSDDAFGAGAANRGEQTGVLIGVTWQPIGYVKFQLNYGQYEADRPGTVNDQEIDSLSIRTQIDW